MVATLGGLLCGAALAQSPVGSRDEVWPNTTGKGTAQLATRVYYPATANGPNAPLAPVPAGGLPVVVFLAGFGHVGSEYPSFCNLVASRGYVVCALDTARIDVSAQGEDGAAMLPALRAASADPGSFFHGALDGSRVGLAGHSAGGGNAIRILDDNPGYRLAVGFATWQGPVINGTSFVQRHAPGVDVPVVLIHGEGDGIIPWRESAEPYFEHLTRAPLRTLVLLDADCDHANLVSYLPISQAFVDVFLQSMDAATSAFDAVLGGRLDALSGVVGERVRGHGKLARLDVGVVRPLLWTEGAASQGSIVRLRMVVHEGEALLMAAGRRASAPTPWGTLLLDPAVMITHGEPVGGSRLLALDVELPVDPNLAGRSLFLQGLGAVEGGGRGLSELRELRVSQ